MNVKLKFEMKIQVDNLDDLDSLGKALAKNLLGELFNGEDVLEIDYKGYSQCE